MARTYFKSPKWMYGFTIVLAIGSGVVAVYSIYQHGLISSLPFILLGLAATVGFLEVSTAYIQISDHQLCFRKNFKRTCIDKSEIKEVTWEAGCGVSVQLQSGEWTKLPELGNSQGQTNSIRAWLRRL